jgi:starch-binding outer membrane protein, SusD/RagB family
MTRDHKPTRHVLLALGIGMMLFAGCDFTEGFDVDPNLATEAAPDLILPAGQLGLAQTAEGDFARVASMWAGQYVGVDRQYSSIQTGSASSEDFNNTWNTAYADGLAQFRLAFEGYRAGGNRVGMGVARVQEALLWGILTSLFGDIPFSEALQPEAHPTPAFDAQASVYAGTQQMLDQAIADLQSNVGGFPSRNIFGLNRTQYIRAAYTVKARHFLHVGNYAAARAAAQQGLQAGDDMIMPHSDDYGAWNNWFAFAGWYRFGYISAPNSHAARMLYPGTPVSRNNAKTNEAARRPYFFTGGSPASADISIIYWGPGAIAATNEPFRILTHVENQLILAEAALHAGNFSLVAQQEAIDALNSVRARNRARWSGGQYDDYTLLDFAPGGIANPQAESTHRAILREILEEKYISLMSSIEPFNDIRRTENFIGVVIPQQDRVPQRFLYAQNEINANPNTPTPIPGVYTETPVNAAFNYTASVPN